MLASCSADRATAVVLVELLLTLLAGAGTVERLAIAEALLLVACARGADRQEAGALLEAINGGEVERITALAPRLLASLTARDRGEDRSAEFRSRR